MSLVATKEYTDPAQMLADYAARRARLYRTGPEPEPETKRLPPILPSVLVFPISRAVSVEEIIDRYKRGHPNCRLFADRKPSNRYGEAATFDVMGVVMRHFKVTKIDMRSTRRQADVVMARQIFCWLMRSLTTYSLPQIGRHLGGRDHTTILHAVRKIDHLRTIKPDVKSLTDGLLLKVRVAGA